MEGNIYLAGLNSFFKFGPRRLKKLWDFFHSWEKAFNSSLPNLQAAGIETEIAREFLSEKRKIKPAELEKKLAAENIKIISFNDKEYPKILKQISDPPAILYARGRLRSDLPMLAVVGARKNTPYGERAVNELIPPLCAKNIGIVSGLAMGIDARAHEKALAANGYTIAVLGTGIDRQSVYPITNKKLSEEIIARGGALISEFPPRTMPLKQNFPLRNRIIAGLARGTLVVEAGIKSGSLITAYSALEENREVLAVPGSIFSPQSQGPNKLIARGAKTVLSADDILEIFGLEKEAAKTRKNPVNRPELNANENLVLANLSDEPTSSDELSNLTKLDIRTINSTLSLLELKGIVKNYGGNYVVSS
jgi:DNA processing protein